MPIDDKRVVEDLQLKVIERDTEIAELEMVKKFNEDKIAELENKNKVLAQEVETLKKEGWEHRLVATRAYSNQKHLSLALFVALIIVVVVVVNGLK